MARSGEIWLAKPIAVQYPDLSTPLRCARDDKVKRLRCALPLGTPNGGDDKRFKSDSLAAVLTVAMVQKNDSRKVQLRESRYASVQA